MFLKIMSSSLSHLATLRHFSTINSGCSRTQLHDRLIAGKASEIFFETDIQLDPLKALYANTIRAIIIPKFIDKKTCLLAGQKLLKSEVEGRAKTEDVGRVGMSFCQAFGSDEMLKKYFEEAPRNRKAVKQIFEPSEMPIDKLRSVLSQIWPHKVVFETRASQEMFSGLISQVENEEEVLPHEDVRERVDPSMPLLKGQLAANVYLQNPEKGGDLELWDFSLDTVHYDRLRNGSQGIKRSLLPHKVMSIKPQEGDLIIFDSRNLHAISQVFGKMQILISTFIGLEEDGSLKLWS